MEIIEITSGAEVIQIVNEYLGNLQGTELEGSEQATQAGHIKNGMPALFNANKQAFFYARDGIKVKGVIRLEIKFDRIHIANVTSSGGGAGGRLVEKAKLLAKEKGKPKVDLSTAEASLVAYYQKLGFQLENPSVQTGTMWTSV